METDSTREKIKTEVARLLSEERTKQGVSMNKLAEKAGLSQSLVSSFETTQWNPTLDSLLRIAGALNINLGDVLKTALKNSEKAKKS